MTYYNEMENKENLTKHQPLQVIIMKFVFQLRIFAIEMSKDSL